MKEKIKTADQAFKAIATVAGIGWITAETLETFVLALNEWQSPLEGWGFCEPLQVIDFENVPERTWSIEVVEEDIVIKHDGGRVYEIDIKTCRTPKQVCHWVCHMAGKSWITKEMLRELVLVALGKDVWDW